jgi:hypothetical protein
MPHPVLRPPACPVTKRFNAVAHALGVTAALGLTIAAGFGASVQAAAPANCISQLVSGSGAELVCSYPTRLGDRERAELRRVTGDLLVDARCMVNVRIERRHITAALVKPDHVFMSPPQTVSCELIMQDEKLPITATVAPRIVIRGGRAVDASPGMANLRGVNEFLAEPVVGYINQSDTIRSEMINMINMYIANKKIGDQVFQNRG